MKPKTFRKKSNRVCRIAKHGFASDAIGKIEKGGDIYILTFGHFSLIDVLAVILEQTGAADVIISSWTAAHAHLEQTAEMVEGLAINSMRMIVDGSFIVRQPAYHARMLELFGKYSVRSIKSHAKFLVVTNDEYNVVVRTSMNLNENPRLENLEITEDKDFADFFTRLTDEIFEEISPDEKKQVDIKIEKMPEQMSFNLVESTKLKRNNFKVPETKYEVK